MAKIRLSQDQQNAVNHADGALLVVAGPGSGKTRVLTERIRRLLEDEKGHFQVLALTFTNKAANEMKERLKDVPKIAERSFIGTLHSFSMDVLSKRGKPVGIDGMPQIFSAYHDRRSILTRAIRNDPELVHQLKLAGDDREQKQKIDYWMRKIITFKSLLLRENQIENHIDRLIYIGYQSELRASGAVDFDDLLLLTYQLFMERPKIANFFRRLYKFICIDEAQDLNGAQYGVLQALCGDEYKNVMMVGDKKQSIYGFNTADPKYMDIFVEEFEANVLEMHENFRSSRTVVQAAKKLDKTYLSDVERLPIQGSVELLIGEDEEDEAEIVVNKLKTLCQNGHPDVEGPITYESCAFLGRTRYTLLEVEEKLRENQIPYYKQLKADYQSESDLLKEFEICLRVLVNPKDRLHLDQLIRSWHIEKSLLTSGVEKLACNIDYFQDLSEISNNNNAAIIVDSLRALLSDNNEIHMNKALDVFEQHYINSEDADENERRSVLEDVKVLRGEWDRFLRIERATGNDIASFLTHMALGTMQQPKQEGVALLTVHSSKGLEFDVIFVVGMSEGTFPDYRSKNSTNAAAEEKRNAFVAVTRSKRLLYFSYPKVKIMPWGSPRNQFPSQYLKTIGLI